MLIFMFLQLRCLKTVYHQDNTGSAIYSCNVTFMPLTSNNTEPLGFSHRHVCLPIPLLPAATICDVSIDLLWIRLPDTVPFRYRKQHSTLCSLVAFLLLTIEKNPGPDVTVRRCNRLVMGVLNARSAVNKAALLHDVIADHQLDILAITETWMRADDPPAVQLDIAPVGYSVCHQYRATTASTSVSYTHLTLPTNREV